VKAEAIRATDEPTVAVLDVDQAELALNPTRTRVWAATGVPWEVETPGNNRKQVLFGAVNSRSGILSIIRGNTAFPVLPIAHPVNADAHRQGSSAVLG